MNSLSLKAIRGNLDFRIIMVVVLYLVASQLSLVFTFPVSKAIVIAPASGVALAFMLIYGRRIWPAIAIGALLSGASIFNHFGFELKFTTIITLALFMLIKTIEILAAYALVVKSIKKRDPFLDTNHLFAFMLISMIVCIIGGFSYAGILSINNFIDPSYFISTSALYIGANLIGIWIFTPLILAYNRGFSITVNKYILFESIGFITLIAAVFYLSNIPEIGSTIIKSYPFLIIPFLLWLAYRGSAEITTSAVVLITFAAAYVTVVAYGPFVLDNESSSLLILQIFIGITGITAIVLNTTVRERTYAEKAIRDFNEKLEDNVKRRTKELEEEISIRKTTQEKMKISNLKLRKANAELDNFVYSVSHDLRAPIASVLGLTNLAEKEKDIEMMKRYVKMIENSSKKQDAFIRDILDLSRNSRLEVTEEPLSFESIVQEILDELKYYHGDKEVNKKVNIKQTGKFFSDKKRLKVILNNLVSNAIRYCTDKDPYINIHIRADDALATVKVEDNGIGIEKEHLHNVFKMFYRATEDNTGSGLGLYIVKETVDKLRGNVSLTSTPDEGTVVNVELPNLKPETELINKTI